MSNFKAIVLNKTGEQFSRELKSIDKSFLIHGDVLVKVDYSDFNYKDGMILKNGGSLVKDYPHIPGIDFAGTVEESKSDKFKTGDKVILTGWRVGEIYYGASDPKRGFHQCNGEMLHPKTKVFSGLMAKESEQLILEFFKKLRE